MFLAAYSGGGSGDFITRHIFDIALARALDLEVYERINLMDLRRIDALGDHWGGEISIAKNTIRVVTMRKGPADETGAREMMTIVARFGRASIAGRTDGGAGPHGLEAHGFLLLLVPVGNWPSRVAPSFRVAENRLRLK